MCLILYGTRTPADRFFVTELDEWKTRGALPMSKRSIGQTTVAGNVGVITTLLPRVPIHPATTRVIICGPPIMYKFVIAGLVARGIPMEHIFVSLERRMKCGVGKCGHCQINGLYTCLDGPVFNYAALVDIPEAR